MEKRYFAYILECSDGTLYCGSTNNLEKRVREHNTSKNGAHYTKIRRPVVLKHFEAFETYAESRKKEAEWKRLSREEKMKYIAKNNIVI
jgi:putative endonuclease